VTVGNRSLSSITSFLLGLAILLGSCATSIPGGNLAEEYYNLGNGWYEQKKYDLAATAYQKALRWNPELQVATMNLARTKAEIGDIDGALSLLDSLAEAGTKNLVISQYRAWLRGKKDGPAAAADLYVALAQELPGDAATLYNAGLCLNAAQRYEEAADYLARWKVLDGKLPKGLWALAEALEATGSQQAPQAWLDAALVHPENDVKRFEPLIRQARLLVKAQRYGEAVETWNEALLLPKSPARAQALFDRGRVLLLYIEDFPEGSQGVISAWNEGYRDTEAWKALRADPLLKFSPQLEAALQGAEVTP